MKILSLLILLATCLPSLAQVWGMFTDMTYMNQARPASAAVTACNSSNLFVAITTSASASDTWPDGTFMCQKIQNTSSSAIRIKRFFVQVQYGSGSGTPTFTGYVRDNYVFGSGSTYGSPSIPTNAISASGLELKWAAGTEPVVPANTDFYIGAVFNKGGTVSYNVGGDYSPGGGTAYGGTNYGAYLNGNTFYIPGNPNTDYCPLEIYVCMEPGVPAMPQSSNIKMFWDSEVAPMGQTIVWYDLTNNVPMSVVNSNTTFMWNTPDGMIMSSGVIGNNGWSRIPAKNLGTNWTVWMTLKKEDWKTTQKAFGNSGSGEILDNNEWTSFWNWTTPSSFALITNTPISVWTDFVVAFSNNSTFYGYINGQYKTNQPKSGSTVQLQDFGTSADNNWPNMEKIGQIAVWTNTVLTPYDVTILHTILTNRMPDLPTMSNALPSSIVGLRNAWRTAGFVGRFSRVWTDYISGKSFTAWADHTTPLSSIPYQYNATGRGFRNWSTEGGLNWRNGWISGDMVFPATFTFFMTWTPTATATWPAENGIFLYTPSGYYLDFNSTTRRVRIFNNMYISPPLEMNQTHALMVVCNGTTSATSYVDGQYYTNVVGGFGAETLNSFGSINQLGNFNNNINGYLGEFLLCTNISMSTNVAADYYTYATNQYGFDWYGGTNAYGDYFTRPLFDRLAFRITSTNVPTGPVTNWIDTIQGKTFTQATSSQRPSKAAGSTNGVAFSRASNQFLDFGSDFSFTQTANSTNDLVFYYIFKPTTTPSGVYHIISGQSVGSFNIGVHPSLTLNDNVGTDIYGTAVLNQINVVVANEGFYNTNRGRWLNGVTNSTSVAYGAGSRAWIQRYVGHTAGFAYDYEGIIYEMGCFTNRIFTPANALAIYQYATNTFR